MKDIYPKTKKIIATKSFKLSVAIRGNENADKVALLLPGRLDTKDYINFDSHLEYLANKGFLAVSFDPPGTWESPGGIELYTTSNYIKAVNELIEYFGNRPTLLFGHSRGGTVAILLAEDNANVTGIIAAMPNLGAPVPPDAESIKNGYKVSYRDFPPGAHRTKQQREFHLPVAYFDDGEKYNPVTVIKNLRKPKMILFGDKDELFDPEIVEKKCWEFPEPKIIKKINSPHSYRRCPEIIVEVNELIGQFIDKFL